MLALPAADGAWAGIVALYSIIRLSVEERATACREFARTVRPGGWLLVSFHVDSDDLAAGSVNQITGWFSQPVQLDGYFLDPPEVGGAVGVGEVHCEGQDGPAAIRRGGVPEPTLLPTRPAPLTNVEVRAPHVSRCARRSTSTRPAAGCEPAGRTLLAGDRPSPAKSAVSPGGPPAANATANERVVTSRYGTVRAGTARVVRERESAPDSTGRHPSSPVPVCS